MSAQDQQEQPTTATEPATEPQQSSSNTRAQTNNAMSPKDELLSCQWTDCNEKCQSPEQLYDHICERHVGRKSTNNLNLTCGWSTCRTTTVKRDHITSHIRVHVPLKPHKCDFCGKAFKRPQDLKKHVKTHADDSVLLRSPEPNGAHRGRDEGYRVQDGKPVIADLQALAATATGYYDTSGASYAQNHPGHSGAAGFYGGQQASYGPVYYAVTQGGDVGHAAAFDSRKRGYDLLNDFFGDAKRKQIDPTSYAEVGQRLVALQGLQLPFHGDGIVQYLPTPVLVAAPVHHGSAPQHQYFLPPMPNLRTKSDLTEVDRFLEQMQSTVYESSNAAAAAGIAQPGAHYTHQGINFRVSNSPPQLHQTMAQQHPSTHAVAPLTATPMMATSSQSTQGGTPALTPASSALSYTSGQSPPSFSSTHGVSPTPRSNVSSMYPTLPTVTGDMSAGYPAHTSAAPASTLGSVFDNDPRRRYSGSNLQRAYRPRSEDDMDTSSEHAVTPPLKAPSHESPREGRQIKSTEVSASLIDPALGGVSSPGAHSADGETSAADKAQEIWVENIRIIEALRKFIIQRLENKEYEDEDGVLKPPKVEGEEDAEMGNAEVRGKTEAEKDAESLYPVLRAVADAD